MDRMSGRGQRGRRRYRCDNCVRLKVKCSEQLPCAKCFELCLPCEPPPSERGKPYAQLALASIEASHLNSLYLAAFKREKDQGNIDVDVYKQQLRIWQSMSRLAQTDLSQGLVSDLCEALGIEDAEIDVLDKVLPPMGSAGSAGEEEGEGSVVGESEGDGGKGGGGEEPDEYLRELHVQIAASESFKMLDDGRWLLRVVMFVDHREVVVWNVLGEQAFMTNEELDTYVETFKMLGIHVLASLFAPEDRVSYYDMLVAQFRISAEPSVVMAKFCKRDGSIALYILRVRRMLFPEFPDRPVAVLTFEPAPESRHLTRRPHHAHRIVQTFKQQHPQQQAQQHEEEAPLPSPPPQDTGPPFVVPGIATIPGDGPNDEHRARYMQIDPEGDAARMFNNATAHGAGGGSACGGGGGGMEDDMDVRDELEDQVGEGGEGGAGLRRSTRKGGSRRRGLEAGKEEDDGRQLQQQHQHRQQQRMGQAQRRGGQSGEPLPPPLPSPRHQSSQEGGGSDARSDDMAVPSRTSSASSISAAAGGGGMGLAELQALPSLPSGSSSEIWDEALIESLSDPKLLRDLDEIQGAEDGEEIV